MAGPDIRRYTNSREKHTGGSRLRLSMAEEYQHLIRIEQINQTAFFRTVMNVTNQKKSVTQETMCIKS